MRERRGYNGLDGRVRSGGHNRHAAHILAALAVLSIASCASDHDIAMAYVEPGFTPKLALPIYVDDPHIACIATGIAAYRDGRRILACADPYGKISSQICTMILPHNPPAWIVEHERLHCERGAWHP